MSRLEIVRIPVLNDNYVWLAHEPAQNLTAVVDPAVADAPLAEAAKRGWAITHILNTHHHGDHTGGNREIKAETGCTVVGPRADRDRIPGIDIEVGDGDSYDFGTARAEVFDVPGHTRGHIAYWFAASDALFCGDTLFLLGCGRLFEGTPAQMWTSLGKLRALPDSANVYCAHEYTQANARFAVTVDPQNADLTARAAEIDRMRAAGIATVPGHTRGHIAYWFAASDALFCGDTLFLLGCGRLFEGTPAQMWTSLGKLRALPDSANVYCAHEYTQANARFAVTVDPTNADLTARAAEIDRMRAAGIATVPGKLGIEKRTNPFLRADDAAVAATVGLAGGSPVEVFAEVRQRKDVFRG